MVKSLKRSEIYASELIRLRYGHPLWCPEPTTYGEVQIGDVGYIVDGTFYRLFNAARPKHDPINKAGVPEGFVPLRLPDVHTTSGVVKAGDALRSESEGKIELSVQGQVPTGPVSVGGNYSFKSSGKRGAVAMLSDGGVQHKVVRSTAFREYIYRHHKSWHAFAAAQGVDVRPDELVLVSGCVKTSSWALAAWDEQAAAHDFSLSLSANGLFTFQPGFNSEKKHNAGEEHREGPTAGPSSRQDQCVFVQYYKCLPKGFGLTVVQDSDHMKERDMRERPPNKYFCAPLAGIGRWFREHFGNCCCCCCCDDPEEVMREAPSAQAPKLEDPIRSVLEYIAQKFPGEVAITSHGALYALLKGLEQWPGSVAEYLAQEQPEILRDTYGARLRVDESPSQPQTPQEDESGTPPRVEEKSPRQPETPRDMSSERISAEREPPPQPRIPWVASQEPSPVESEPARDHAGERPHARNHGPAPHWRTHAPSLGRRGVGGHHLPEASSGRSNRSRRQVRSDEQRDSWNSDTSIYGQRGG